jgi:hypothetical protein
MAEVQTEKWLDLDEAARHVGYSKKTISRWLADTELPLEHLNEGKGGKVIIACSTLDAYMHRRAAMNVARGRVHFVTSLDDTSPAACGRMRDGLLLSDDPTEVDCKVCLEIVTA